MTSPQCSWCDRIADYRLIEQHPQNSERPWIDYGCLEHAAKYLDGYRPEPLLSWAEFASR